jgi:hypothetical protein
MEKESLTVTLFKLFLESLNFRTLLNLETGVQLR